MNTWSFNNNDPFYLTLLCPGHYAKFFTYIISFNPFKNSMR